ncbi:MULTISPECIES: hypothetical protein [unclassified Frankia]|uniref:hypothetical protein n=1 Tax=unclassified Frankia TaxID=2632575 RepID=UPI001EF62D28|nr:MULTISPECIES: hypothetical protein [unclassified Frankia]
MSCTAATWSTAGAGSHSAASTSSTPRQANGLKIAVLGRHIAASAFDRDAVEQALADVGLTGRLSVEDAREIVSAIVLPAFDIALRGLAEAAEQARGAGVPVLAPRRGRVVPGALADLVVTDPAELDKVGTVMLGGEIVVRHGRRVTP